MPRKRFRLNSDRLNKSPGSYCDGDGLYFVVASKTAAAWVLRYGDGYRTSGAGKRYPIVREMGLGSYPEITLARARELAVEARRQKAEGLDPIAERRRLRVTQRACVTFKGAAESYIAAHASEWKNAKHAAQWKATLASYAYPTFGDLPVSDVDITSVHKALEPIWTTKNETARRVRGRIEAVLDWAAAREYRQGDNPAQWKRLKTLLGRGRQAKHHAALPYDELPEFMGDLQAEVGTAAVCLSFLILTAARTSEALCVEWQEINLEKGLWTVPAAKIKAGREHRVPLSKAALEILHKRHKETGGKGFVFAGERPKKPLSNMSMLNVLKRMKRDDLTVHGFRSTFRDWIEEKTHFPGSVAEAALAHVIGDKTEAAYRRGDLFEKRRELMTAWANYCTAPKNSVAVIQLCA